MKRIIQIVTLLALTLTVAQAQDSRLWRDHGDTWIEQLHGTLSSARNLKLITDVGSVQVTGGAGNNIDYTVRVRVYADSEAEARRLVDAIHISAGGDDETAWIKGTAPRHIHELGVDFSVSVPRSVELVSARTGGGALAVRSVAGKVEAETGGGGVQLDDIGGPIDAQSGGGNVNVGMAGDDVRIQTGGGRIDIRSAKGAIQAESGGGNIEIGYGVESMDLETGGGGIHVDRSGSDLRASTGGGKIIAGNIGGKAELETGGGGIELAGANGMVHAQSGGGSMELYKLTHGADIETGGGGIVAEFVGKPANFSTSRLETGAGDIKVYLPANLAVTVDAAIDVSDGHSINTDFSELKVTSEGGDWGGPHETHCTGKINGGGPMLHVHTTTGNIEFVKSNPKP